MVAAMSDPTCLHRLDDPSDDLVEHLGEAHLGLETQHLAGLCDVGHSPLDVVLERLVADVLEGYAGLELRPDQLRELKHRGGFGGGEIEILVQGGLCAPSS